MRVIRIVGLWGCLFLFMARVIGQIYLGIYGNIGILYYLPQWEYWYSGALPYPILLVSQILIIQFLTLMAYDFSRQNGFFFIESPKIQWIVRFLAILYFTSMVVRAIWFDENHFIPIIFHCVLALFLFIYSFSGRLHSNYKK
jgi:hypothetical protein